MRTDCAERLEFTLLGLGDHRLGVGKDLPLPIGMSASLTETGVPALPPAEAPPDPAASEG